MRTPVGSPEGCVLSSSDCSRLTVMPGRRSSDSEADLSGKAPMSVAVTESTIVAASFFSCSALEIASFWPTTITSASGSV